jgi:hypothetical protein
MYKELIMTEPEIEKRSNGYAHEPHMPEGGGDKLPKIWFSKS